LLFARETVKGFFLIFSRAQKYWRETHLLDPLLEVEVTRATRPARRRRTPLPPPPLPAAASRHRRTPDHTSQGWVIGILSLFLSYLWMTSTSAAKTRFILDIAKTFLSLDIAERRLWSRKISRSCLQNKSVSVWRKLYEAQHDQGLITLTGFDCACFASLCEIFAPIFDSYTPFIPSGTSCFKREKQKNKGMRRKIRPEDCLGRFLAWTRTRGLLVWHCSLFLG
jgi:hypothetical protein